MKKYYFITGFPRSGSTLLAGILNQNPKFYASMSTTLCNLFCEVQYNKSMDVVSLSTEQAKNLYYRTLQAYYDHVDSEIVFDTSRQWPRFDSLLTNLFPYTKIVCCVRDIPSILNSFEYYYKFKTFKAPGFVSPDGANNPWTRLEDWFNGMVSQPYENCDYAFHSPLLRDLYHFVDYTDLVTNPKETIKTLYNILNLEEYDHDFENIHHSFESVDVPVSNDGLHTVKRKIGETDTKWVLPPGAVEKYTRNCFWRNE